MKEIGTALGFIETLGLVAAVTAADAALKAADVRLVGREISKGEGRVTVKIRGDVGAVKAALAAASVEAKRVGKVFAAHVIARPGAELDPVMVRNRETLGAADPLKPPPVPVEAALPEEPGPFEAPERAEEEAAFSPAEAGKEEAPATEGPVPPLPAEDEPPLKETRGEGSAGGGKTAPKRRGSRAKGTREIKGKP